MDCHVSDHNVALKFTRDMCERDGHWSHEYNFSVALQQTAVAADRPERIPFIVKKATGGEAYAFSKGMFFDWSPELMLANLDKDDLRKVVHGPKGKSGGIVKCCCSAMDNNYDHGRATAAKLCVMTWQRADKSKPHETWDFVCHRDDNSSCWLHPNFGDGKVAYGEGACPNLHSSGVRLHAPTSGPGGSGYKLFKYYKEARVDEWLKFDKSKNTIKRKRDAGEVMPP